MRNTSIMVSFPSNYFTPPTDKSTHSIGIIYIPKVISRVYTLGDINLAGSANNFKVRAQRLHHSPACLHLKYIPSGPLCMVIFNRRHPIQQLFHQPDNPLIENLIFSPEIASSVISYTLRKTINKLIIECILGGFLEHNYRFYSMI